MTLASIGPDAARALDCDAQWRARLVDSLGYLGEILADRGEATAGRLARVCDTLAAGQVSPWTSCLYSKLVAELTRRDARPFGGVLDGVCVASDRPPSEPPVALDDSEIPADWWDHLRVLMDTDWELPFRPIRPSLETADACRREIADATALLERADPDFAAEMRELVRVIVLGAPETSDPKDDFGACSTFFLRELVLVNAARRRSAIQTLDMLIHEASHILLFGLSMRQPLTTDRGETRHISAARKDLRPIDGIFHAAFVSTRVHLAMSRMIASGRLNAGETAEAIVRRDRNDAIARSSVATVAGKAPLTETGAAVLAGLTDYWSGAAEPALASAG